MIVQQLYKVLVDKWPALLTISAIVYMGFFVATLPARLIRRVPLVGQELGGYEKRRIAYQNNAQRLYSEGYRLVRANLQMRYLVSSYLETVVDRCVSVQRKHI